MPQKYQLTDTRDGKVVWTGHTESPEQAKDFYQAECDSLQESPTPREFLKAEVVPEKAEMPAFIRAISDAFDGKTGGAANSGVESGEKETARHESGAQQPASQPGPDSGVKAPEKAENKANPSGPAKSRQPRKDKGVTRGPRKPAEKPARIRAKGKWYIVSVNTASFETKEAALAQLEKAPANDIEYMPLYGRRFKYERKVQYKLIPE